MEKSEEKIDASNNMIGTRSWYTSSDEELKDIDSNEVFKDSDIEYVKLRQTKRNSLSDLQNKESAKKVSVREQGEKNNLTEGELKKDTYWDSDSECSSLNQEVGLIGDNDKVDIDAMIKSLEL